jgi:hypothetical protein
MFISRLRLAVAVGVDCPLPVTEDCNQCITLWTRVGTTSLKQQHEGEREGKNKRIHILLLNSHTNQS